MVVLEGFLGTELPAGDYAIRMVYHCPGLLRGFVATLLGIAAFWFLYKMEKDMRRNPSAGKERIIKEEQFHVEKEVTE